MKYLFFFFLIIPFLGFTQQGPINVYMKSGNIISTSYAYLNSNGSFSKPFVRIHNKKGEKIPITQITHIEGVDQNGIYKYFRPIRFRGGEIWGERTYTSDHINIFSTSITSGSWTSSSTSSILKYSKNDQPLKNITYKNLKLDISDNIASKRYLKKGKAIKITQWLLYGVGAALVANAFSGDFSGDSDDGSKLKIPPTLIAGAIVLYVPWLINGRKQDHFIDALENYK